MFVICLLNYLFIYIDIFGCTNKKIVNVAHDHYFCVTWYIKTIT